jgi:hypothetical protein
MSSLSPYGEDAWTGEEPWGRLVAWLKVKGMNVSEDFPVVCKPSRGKSQRLKISVSPFNIFQGAGNGLFATRSIPVRHSYPAFRVTESAYSPGQPSSRYQPRL